MVVVDYYEGAYGPTLRLDARSLSDLHVIRAVMRRLADGCDMLIDLGRQPGFRIQERLAAVTLKADRRQEWSPAIMVSEVPATVTWALRPEEWRDACELLDGLGGDGQPGHHYVSDNVRGSGVAIVAYLEGSGGM